MLTPEQITAVLDGLSYYALCDYGHGDERPLSPDQEEHRAHIKAAIQRLEEASA